MEADGRRPAHASVQLNEEGAEAARRGSRAVGTVVVRRRLGSERLIGVTCMFRKRTSDQQLDAELRDHIERLVAINVESGMKPDEARRRALIEFGNPEA